jgi:hypothetical protein
LMNVCPSFVIVSSTAFTFFSRCCCISIYSTGYIFLSVTVWRTQMRTPCFALQYVQFL